MLSSFTHPISCEYRDGEYNEFNNTNEFRTEIHNEIYNMNVQSYMHIICL